MVKRRFSSESRMCTKKKDFLTNQIVLDTLNEKIKQLQKEKAHDLEIISKMLKPFVKLDIPHKTFEKILEGKFETKIFVDKNGCLDPLTRRLGWVIELDDWDLGVR